LVTNNISPPFLLISFWRIHPNSAQNLTECTTELENLQQYIQSSETLPIHKKIVLIEQTKQHRNHHLMTLTIERNCDVLPKTSNIHSRRMVLLRGGGADDNSKRRERASDDGAA